jgi:hypothetical protein
LSLQGKVKIDITVSVDGHVTETKVIGGHPSLAKSSFTRPRTLDSVALWPSSSCLTR